MKIPLFRVIGVHCRELMEDSDRRFSEKLRNVNLVAILKKTFAGILFEIKCFDSLFPYRSHDKIID